MTKLQRLIRRPAPERGFTLIELLVVIIILGILAAVVVFAVSGVGDKGKSSAVSIDERTIQTAEEAYCAKNGQYGSGQELVAGGFLSELPAYHEVNAQQTGGPCNGWRYSILRTAQAGDYGPGSWEPLALPANFAARGYIVRLPDGKVLMSGNTVDTSAPTAQVWDPNTGTWAATDPPPYSTTTTNAAMVLKDDPSTPKNECAGVTVNNCGKVLVYGKWLFDPTQAPNQVPPRQWETIPLPPGGQPDCWICTNTNLFEIGAFAYVQLEGPEAVCGTNCGKVVLFNGGGTCAPECTNVFDIYDPTTNTYESRPYPDPFLTGYLASAGQSNQLPDGRVFICCEPGAGGSLFFDPVTLSFLAGPMAPDRYYRNLDSQPAPVLPNGDLLFAHDLDAPRTTSTYTPQASGPGTFSTGAGCYTDGNVDFDRCLVMGSLADGRVVAAKSNQIGSLTSSEVYVYNPVVRTWSRATDILNPEDYRFDALLLDPFEGPCGAHCGKLLVAGTNAELFVP